MIPQHHVVLDHAQPLRLGIAAGSWWFLFSLKGRSLLDVGGRPDDAAFLVVPQREANRPFGPDIGASENTRELHNERRARRIVVGSFA